MTDPQPMTMDSVLITQLAVATNAWAALGDVSRALSAVAVGFAGTAVWLGLARLMDRSMLIWRPSRGFALGVVAATAIPFITPPALAAFIQDRVAPFVWSQAGMVDAGAMALGVLLALIATAVLQRRRGGFARA